MDKNLHNIEDLFKKGLEGSEDSPSEKVWQTLDKRLDKETVINIKKKYRRLQQCEIFLLILIFASGISIYLFTRQDEKKIIENQINIFNKFTNKNNHLKSSASTPNSGLEYKNDGGKILKIDSIQQRHDSYVNKNLAEEKIPKKGEKIIFENNNKESHSNIHSKKVDNKTISLNKTAKKNLDKKELADNQLPAYNFIEKKPQSKTAFSKSHSSQKLSLIPEIVFAQKINSKPDVFFSPVLVDVNKSFFSNKSKIKPGGKSHFSLTAFYSHNITFYNYQNSQSLNSNSTDFEKDENYASSSTLGVLAEYLISKHFSLQSGLTLSTTNIDLAPETIYAQTDNYGKIKYQINTSSGYGYILPSFNNNPSIGDSLLSISTSHTLQYVGIPEAIKYSIHKGKFAVNARAGLVTNFLTKGIISTEVEKGNDNEIETTDKIHGLKSFYLSGITGVGLDYNVYKNWSVSFSPTFRFALNSINKNLPIKSYPNSVGFSLGVKTEL